MDGLWDFFHTIFWDNFYVPLWEWARGSDVEEKAVRHLHFLLPKWGIILVVLYCLVGNLEGLYHLPGRTLRGFASLKHTWRSLYRKVTGLFHEPIGEEPPPLPKQKTAPGVAKVMAGDAAEAWGSAYKVLTWGRRGIRAVLAICLFLTAILAVGNYTFYNGKLGEFRYQSFFNAYEFYHYYIGTKYAREVGYTDMYNATIIADKETGFKYRHKSKTIRNLDTGRHVPVGSVLKQPEKYKRLFSTKRWAEFTGDIEWFKENLDQSKWMRWSGMLRDKGYNSTPVWSMVVGGLFSNQVSTENEAGMNFLAALDAILICLATACVVWAFGPRTAMLLLVFLGTSYMSKWWHMKGAFLRTDFTMALVMAACMIKKDRYKTAGVLTGWAVLSRVFPAVFLFGLGAKVLWELIRVFQLVLDDARMRWQSVKARLGYGAAALVPLALGAILLTVVITKKVSPEDIEHLPWPFWLALQGYVLLPALFVGLVLAATGVWGLLTHKFNTRYVHFFVAFAITVVIFVGATIVHWDGPEIWSDFKDKITYHNKSISTWRVGFKYLFIGTFKEEQTWGSVASAMWNTDGPWRQGFEEGFKELTPRSQRGLYNSHSKLWWAIQIFVLGFSLFAAKYLKDHQAFLYSFVPLFFLAASTYYYYIMLIVPLLFFAERVEKPGNALGMAMMYVIAMAGYVFYSWHKQNYFTYYWLSFLILLTVLLMMLLALWRNREPLRAAIVTGACVVFGLYICSRWPLIPPGEGETAFTLLALVMLFGMLVLCLGVVVVTEVVYIWGPDLSRVTRPVAAAFKKELIDDSATEST